ncbi:OmpA family protein [Nitrospira sp. Ecomares 2.1]
MAWALLCGAIGTIQESFANPLDIFPPYSNFQEEAGEEIHDTLIVSIPVTSFGKGRGSEPFVEDMYQDPVFADVYFDDVRSSIQGGIEGFLHETVALLKQEDQWGVRIEGHCDSRGTSAYNLARADYHLRFLAGFLEQLGIPSRRIHPVNFGQTPFSCQSGSEWCQEDNLRAERIFSILAVDRFQRGCLARLRFVAGKDSDRATGYLKRPRYLQRIQLASPQFTSLP